MWSQLSPQNMLETLKNCLWNQVSRKVLKLSIKKGETFCSSELVTHPFILQMRKNPRLWTKGQKPRMFQNVNEPSKITNPLEIPQKYADLQLSTAIATLL